MFGLGEAGSLLAADLVGSGADVSGFDPADVATPNGVRRCVHPSLAVGEADVVLAVTSGTDAKLALLQSLDAMKADALYADLSTGSPELKNELAAVAGTRELEFADVALMSMVPGNGLATPALASGPGAMRYASIINDAGGDVEPIDGPPGAAAARKLLRSVMMKGTAAVLVEAVEAGAAVGDLKWLWEHLAMELGAADHAWMHRLVTGSKTHARRRHDEMEAAASLLDGLGVPSTMTRATAASLERLIDAELPELPDLPGPPIPDDLQSSVLQSPDAGSPDVGTPET